MSALNSVLRLQATLAAQQMASAPAPAPVPVPVAPVHQPTPPPVAAPYPAYNNPPQPIAPVAPVQPAPIQLPTAFEALPEDQKAMIRSVLSMTPEQINLLEPAQRAGILQLVYIFRCPSRPGADSCTACTTWNPVNVVWECLVYRYTFRSQVFLRL